MNNEESREVGETSSKFIIKKPQQDDWKGR